MPKQVRHDRLIALKINKQPIFMLQIRAIVNAFRNKTEYDFKGLDCQYVLNRYLANVILLGVVDNYFILQSFSLKNIDIAR